jgi:hypothetical protein
MKTRTTTSLLVLFFGGLLALWWADRAHVPTSEQRRKMSGLVLPELIGVGAEGVRKVEIVGGKEPVVLERRDGGRWQLTSPIDAAADRAKVMTLVGNLKELPRTADAAPLSGPGSKYGLDPPARTIRLFAAGAARPLAVLEVGKAAGERSYVRPGGAGEIEVVDSKLLGAVYGTAADWRERTIFPVFSFDVQNISINGPGRDLEAARSDGAWRVVKPFRAPGDDERLDGVVADLTALRVAEGTAGFVADRVKDMAPYGLDRPTFSIEVITRGNASQPLSLLVGKEVPGKQGKLYARRGDQHEVLELDAARLASLGKDAYQFRGRQVARLDARNVRFIEAKASRVTYQLALVADAWRILAPEPGPADARVVGDLLAQVQALQASAVVPPAEVTSAGLDAPAASFAFWEGDDAVSSKPAREPDLALAIGRFDSRRGAVHVQTGGDSNVLLVPETTTKLVPRGRFAYRDRVLMNLPPDQIERITVERNGETFELESSGKPRDYGHWKLTKPVVAPADAEAAARLDLLISHLRAESLVAERPSSDLTEYGLDRPTAKVSWHKRGTADGPNELLVGGNVADSPGSCYALLGGGASPVFTLSAAAAGIVRAELHDRKVVTFPEDQARRLVLRWPDRTVAAVREERPFAGEPDWKTDQPGFGLDSQRLKTLVHALAALTTPRFAQYRGRFPAQSGLGRPRLVIEVELAGGLGTRQLRMGDAEASGFRHATTESGDSGAVVLLPDQFWAPWVRLHGEREELPANVFAPE